MARNARMRDTTWASSKAARKTADEGYITSRKASNPSVGSEDEDSLKSLDKGNIADR